MNIMKQEDRRNMDIKINIPVVNFVLLIVD